MRNPYAAVIVGFRLSILLAIVVSIVAFWWSVYRVVPPLVEAGQVAWETLTYDQAESANAGSRVARVGRQEVLGGLAPYRRTPVRERQRTRVRESGARLGEVGAASVRAGRVRDAYARGGT